MDSAEIFKGLSGKGADCFASLRTPCYVLDEERLRQNGEILSALARRTGAKILLAQKAFSNYDLYPLLAPYLAGTEASGLYEARLGAEEMPGKEVHVFCAAYRPDEFDELLEYADHIVFNSVRQLAQFGEKTKARGKSLGLRINPECSTQEGHALYDPCAKGSRLGVTREAWDREMTEDLMGLLDGLHFHTLCEQDADALETTLRAVETKFRDILPRMKWLNLGGGHHITREDYDRPLLERLITEAQRKWDLQVYLEPGEAVALNAGYLVTEILDITENGGIRTAILDASAACHMPDVLEMPYTPPLLEGDREKKAPFAYRLAGPTCLAGDVIGEY
ncbi:MAG: carboxynorspermidine decarboxylase, partial [Oscillospiraceae bacterium]|nr:carboxynorspermidine decarboxylase [Oscillospiraceae bacterium]